MKKLAQSEAVSQVIVEGDRATEIKVCLQPKCSFGGLLGRKICVNFTKYPLYCWLKYYFISLKRLISRRFSLLKVLFNCVGPYFLPYFLNKYGSKSDEMECLRGGALKSKQRQLVALFMPDEAILSLFSQNKQDCIAGGLSKKEDYFYGRPKVVE